MELIERVAAAVCEAMYGKQFDAHQMPEAYGHADRIAKAAIRAMLDGVESNLSAVQYDPAPYTAMKHRIAAMRKDVE